MNLAEIRDAVRAQMDLPEEEDLPTALIDLYVAEGYNNVINREARWPFFALTTTVSTVADGSAVAIPSNVSSIDAITFEGRTLEFLPHEQAEARFGSDSGTPRYFSVWGSELYFWPAPNSVDEYTVRGWRFGDDSWVSAAANEPDTGTERRLDRALVHYAVSRAYAAQEDPDFSAFYLDSFERTVGEAHRAIMRPPYKGRIVMGKGIPNRYRRRFVWDVSP